MLVFVLVASVLATIIPSLMMASEPKAYRLQRFSGTSHNTLGYRNMRAFTRRSQFG